MPLAPHYPAAVVEPSISFTPTYPELLARAADDKPLRELMNLLTPGRDDVADPTDAAAHLRQVLGLPARPSRGRLASLHD